MSVFMDVLNSVRDRIRGLGLTGLSSDEIKVRRLPTDGEVYFPGISIHPAPERFWRGTNEREDIGYGAAVTMVQNNDQDQDYLLDRLLTWRRTIVIDFVEDTSLTGVSTVYTVKVEFGPVIIPGEQNINYDVSQLIIRAWSRETRT